MIDINLIRDNPNTVKTALLNRHKDVSLLDIVIKLDGAYRQILGKVETLRSEQNKISKEIKGKPSSKQLQSAKKIKDQLKYLETNLKDAEKKLNSFLEEIPNIPAEDVPIGKDEADNVVIKTVGQKPIFDFQPLDHQDIGEKLDIIDTVKASEISGSRFGYYKNDLVILEMSLMTYAVKKLQKKAFVPMLPPLMIKSQTEWACGYASNKNLFGAYYSLPEDDLVFISSSEHSVVPYHMNEILNKDIFPIKYVNFSPCFRRESGTYGKDMKGMLRVHHFNKVEMNVFTLPDYKVSDAMCLEMLSIEEKILQELGLHYQVMKCSTGDLPQPNRRMYDINTWFPGQNAYKETSSCSNCGDYQARRLNTKVKINNQNEYVHILNATVVNDRLMLALVENFQQKNGSVHIPEVLWPYTGFKVISPKK